ncbi:hypothetical protein P3S67_014467 [Capsicum chacoense]
MEEKIGHGFKLLISCPSGLSHSQVSVVFDEAYDPTLELSISEIWDARVQQSSSLYNGTKFRYSGYNFDVGNNSKQQPHVSLHLGLTDYRTFMGTNLSPMWERFLVPSEGKQASILCNFCKSCFILLEMILPCISLTYLLDKLQ